VLHFRLGRWVFTAAASLWMGTGLGAFGALLGSCAALPPADTPSFAEAAPLGPTPAPDPAREVANSRIVASAELAAVGDLLMHGAVKESASAQNELRDDGTSANFDGYGALFAHVAEELRSADLAFANLETPIAPKTDRGSRPFVFNAPPALLPALQDAGVGIVAFANNHVYDQGRAGFVETLEELERAGLPQVGAGASCDEAASARILDVNGIRLAFLGATKLFNNDLNRTPTEPCAFLLDEAVLIEKVRLAREEGAELVIASLHWGVEYETAPRKAEIEQAHRLLDAGVDVILGHHPHVLQPVEVYETRDGRITFVAYSLGNFVSNQSRTYTHGLHPEKMGFTRDGLLLRFRAVRRVFPDGAVRTELADLVAHPLWTENNAVSRGRDPKLPPMIRVIHSDRAIEEARAALEGEVDEARKVELQRRIETLEDRRRLVGRIVGDDLLP